MFRAGNSSNTLYRERNWVLQRRIVDADIAGGIVMLPPPLLLLWPLVLLALSTPPAALAPSLLPFSPPLPPLPLPESYTSLHLFV